MPKEIKKYYYTSELTRVSTEAEIENGAWNGKCIYYFNNEKHGVSSVYNFVNNEANGLSESFNTNTTRGKFLSWKNGEYHGVQVWFLYQ